MPNLTAVANGANRLCSLFEPCLSLRWRGRYFYPDRVKDRSVLGQFMDEAGVKNNGKYISPDQYDAILAAAGQHDYSIQTIGGPGDDEDEVS